MANSATDNYNSVAQSAKFQRRVQRYGWDAAAQTYDAVWRENLRPAHTAMFEIAALKPGEQVFELACGSGFATLQAAELVGEQGQVMATDISAQMISILQARILTLGLGHVSARRVGAEEDEICAAQSFDVALCSLGLMFFPEPELGLRNMWNALKPGGRAIAAVWGQRSKCKWADIFPVVERTVESEVCPLFFSLGSGDALAQGFQTQGFESVQSRRIDTCLHFENERSFLTSQIDGGAVALAAKRFDAATRRQVEREFLETVEMYRDGNGYSIPAEFVVVAGEKPAAS